MEPSLILRVFNGWQKRNSCSTSRVSAIKFLFHITHICYQICTLHCISAVNKIQFW